MPHAWGMNTLLDFYHLPSFVAWKAYGRECGISPWREVVDWIGGWPFEVATPEVILRFYRDRSFVLQNLATSQGSGCKEFVFSIENYIIL